MFCLFINKWTRRESNPIFLFAREALSPIKLPAHIKDCVLVLAPAPVRVVDCVLTNTHTRKESNLNRTGNVSALLFIHKAPSENYDISTPELTAPCSASELTGNKSVV